eukprot:1157416-Pelagomonas_calceolata.AAC.4
MESRSSRPGVASTKRMGLKMQCTLCSLKYSPTSLPLGGGSLGLEMVPTVTPCERPVPRPPDLLALRPERHDHAYSESTQPDTS